MADFQYYETLSGLTIHRMRRLDNFRIEVVVENSEILLMDPILSRVVGGDVKIYIEEIPEVAAAGLGEWICPRRR